VPVPAPVPVPVKTISSPVFHEPGIGFAIRFKAEPGKHPPEAPQRIAYIASRYSPEVASSSSIIIEELETNTDSLKTKENRPDP
jgi:hypothetical protein